MQRLSKVAASSRIKLDFSGKEVGPKASRTLYRKEFARESLCIRKCGVPHTAEAGTKGEDDDICVGQRLPDIKVICHRQVRR